MFHSSFGHLSNGSRGGLLLFQFRRHLLRPPGLNTCDASSSSFLRSSFSSPSPATPSSHRPPPPPPPGYAHPSPFLRLDRLSRVPTLHTLPWGHVQVPAGGRPGAALSRHTGLGPPLQCPSQRQQQPHQTHVCQILEGRPPSHLVSSQRPLAFISNLCNPFSWSACGLAIRFMVSLILLSSRLPASAASAPLPLTFFPVVLF